MGYIWPIYDRKTKTECSLLIFSSMCAAFHHPTIPLSTVPRSGSTLPPTQLPVEALYHELCKVARALATRLPLAVLVAEPAGSCSMTAATSSSGAMQGVTSLGRRIPIPRTGSRRVWKLAKNRLMTTTWVWDRHKTVHGPRLSARI